MIIIIIIIIVIIIITIIIIFIIIIMIIVVIIVTIIIIISIQRDNINAPQHDIACMPCHAIWIHLITQLFKTPVIVRMQTTNRPDM